MDAARVQRHADARVTANRLGRPIALIDGTNATTTQTHQLAFGLYHIRAFNGECFAVDGAALYGSNLDASSGQRIDPGDYVRFLSEPDCDTVTVTAYVGSKAQICPVSRG